MLSTRRNAVAVAPNPWKVPTNTEARETAKRRPSRGAFLIGVLSSAALVAGFIGISSSASASTSQWKLGSYTAKGGYGFQELKIPTFSFPTVPAQCVPAPACQGNTGVGPSLLETNSGGVVGNLLEKTISATFTISGSTPGAFTYGGEPDGSGGGATVRLYFDSSPILVGHQVPSNYWWSQTAWVALTGDGTFTLTALVDPGTATASWSDYYGEPSNTKAAFDSAASSVHDVGVSFGGGYFFSNGVGTTDGLGTFTLNSLTVS